MILWELKIYHGERTCLLRPWGKWASMRCETWKIEPKKMTLLVVGGVVMYKYLSMIRYTYICMVFIVQNMLFCVLIFLLQ